MITIASIAAVAPVAGAAHPAPSLDRDTEILQRVERLAGTSLRTVVVHRHSRVPAVFAARGLSARDSIYLADDDPLVLAHELWHVARSKRSDGAPTASSGCRIHADAADEATADLAARIAVNPFLWRFAETDGWSALAPPASSSEAAADACVVQFYRVSPDGQSWRSTWDMNLLELLVLDLEMDRYRLTVRPESTAEYLTLKRDDYDDLFRAHVKERITAAQGAISPTQRDALERVARVYASYDTLENVRNFLRTNGAARDLIATYLPEPPTGQVATPLTDFLGRLDGVVREFQTLWTEVEEHFAWRYRAPTAAYSVQAFEALTARMTQLLKTLHSARPDDDHSLLVQLARRGRFGFGSIEPDTSEEAVLACLVDAPDLDFDTLSSQNRKFIVNLALGTASLGGTPLVIVPDGEALSHLTRFDKEGGNRGFSVWGLYDGKRQTEAGKPLPPLIIHATATHPRGDTSSYTRLWARDVKLTPPKWTYKDK